MKISYDTYLKLKGLMALAVESNKKTDEYIDLAGKLVHEVDDFGDHVMDAIYGWDENVEELLQRLNIEIEKE